MNKSDKVINLNLGCGELYDENFINVDINPNVKTDMQFDVKDLKNYFNENSVDKIMLIHVLSYLRFWEALEFLKDSYNVLKPNGKIIIEIPDISKIAKNITKIKSLKKEKSYYKYIEMLRAIYAFDLGQHKNKEKFTTYAFGWSAMHLKHEMEKIGFKNIKILKPQYHSRLLHRDFRLEAEKLDISLKNKKIAFIASTNKNTGSTRIRLYSIAEELIKRGYDVSINKDIKKADILFFQKSIDKNFQKKFFKSLYTNKFIVFDIDDLFIGDYLKLIKFSDLVITSCDYMKQKYLKLNDNIAVLDGTYDVIDENIPLANFNLKEAKIGWFGTLYNLTLIEKFGIKNVKTITLGGDIEWSIETVDKDIQKFDLIVLPQEKTPAGLAKDNCRMLKTLFLGVPVLASDIPEYVKLAEFLNYPKEFLVKDGEDWNEKIEKIKSGEIKFDFDFEKCRKTLIDNYSIQKRADLWLDIVSNAYIKRGNFSRHMKKVLSSNLLFKKNK